MAEGRAGTGGGEIPQSSPYGFYTVALALVLAALAFVVALFVFKTDIANMTAALGPLYTLFGTLVGAYFGIKATNDANDKARVEVKRANDKTNKALAALDPEKANPIVGEH